ncbi:glycoside hydrolase family 43 protein [Segatella paludivivens]|uniref:glycoside hydrolase family 43 protein n=1 Tax=Segatella paludivivens TaxID=185294 RepID=UPI00037F9544|nr:glycoside hydrolase family 43 protein [Segatella paludivivens]
MKRILLSIFMTTAAAVSFAQNPIVQTNYTTDPAPMADGDRMYVYTGHDEDNANFFWMNDWRVYSSADMVNWTDHGSPLSLASFSWADGRAWAAQTIKRNGKYYWYVCAHSKLSGAMAIGVAVGDSPTGPFKDAIGKPLADGNWDYIDPTVMLDDDGQAYLCWGNPRIYFCKLNKDMVSIDGQVEKIPMTAEGFGGPTFSERQKGVKYKDSYVEGPWLMKRNKNYYLLYAAGGVPEHIAYSMAKKPFGPWKYMGEVMPLSNTGSFTNHCGVADFKGHSYFFYHTGKLPKGGGFGRSVAVEEFKYNKDGSFPIIQPTSAGVEPIGTMNPKNRVEAETMAFSKGVRVEQNEETGVYVSDIHNGDSIVVRVLDFGTTSPKTFTASVASALQGGKIEVHADKPDGKLLCTLTAPYTGGWEKWQTVDANLNEEITGIHNLYFLFKGNQGAKLFNFDWWQFK